MGDDVHRESHVGGIQADNLLRPRCLGKSLAETLDLVPDQWLRVGDRPLGEIRIEGGTSQTVEAVRDSREARRGRARKSRPGGIFVALLGRGGIELFVKVGIADVKLIGVDLNNGACTASLRLYSGKTCRVNYRIYHASPGSSR